MSEPKLGPYGKFLNKLLTDPDLLRTFLADMNKVMEEYHLTEAQRVGLFSGNHALIEANFVVENPKFASAGFVRAPQPPTPPPGPPSHDGGGFVRVSDLISAVNAVNAGSGS